MGRYGGAYANRLFPNSNPWPISYQSTTLSLHQALPYPYRDFEIILELNEST